MNGILRQHFARLDKEVEAKSVGHGKVHVRKMTPEEYEKYKGKPKHTDVYGRPLKPAIYGNVRNPYKW